jgi:prepilin-type N-terminal cleavage/methylation domain-containing protein
MTQILRTARAGFTLVELTVVVTIIAILAAILFPVFSHARESSRKTTCASNLYQVGAALQLYARDYDGRFPPADHDLRPVTQGYLNNSSVLRCAGDWVPESAWRGWTGPYSGSYQYRGGLSIEDRADLPIAGEWAFSHTNGAVALTVSGSVKFYGAKDWVPLAKGPRPLPAGISAPAGLETTPFLGEKPRPAGDSLPYAEE